MVREGEEESLSPRSVGTSPNLSPMGAHAHAGEASEPSNGGDCRTQRTICKMSERNAVISIAVIDEHSFTRECIIKSLTELCNLLDLVAFAGCDDCLHGPRTHDLILYHAHESVATRDNNEHLE